MAAAHHLSFLFSFVFVGGLKEIKARHMVLRRPEYLLRNAVSGMLPKNVLRQKFLFRLRLFADSKVPRAYIENCSTVGAEDPSTQTQPPTDKEVRQRLLEYYQKVRFVLGPCSGGGVRAMFCSVVILS